jgi:hypothetical protein
MTVISRQGAKFAKKEPELTRQNYDVFEKPTLTLCALCAFA